MDFSNLKTIKDVLMNPYISQNDKNRTLRCYEKVKLYYEMKNKLPI